MSEPSSSVPGEIADAEVDAPAAPTQAQSVEIDVDQDKVDAWEDVKSDYEVAPDGQPVPNSMDQLEEGREELDEDREELGGEAADTEDDAGDSRGGAHRADLG